jgi:hypothetical protein
LLASAVSFSHVDSGMPYAARAKLPHTA